jgi:site-specific recombinase XerD
MNHLKLIKSAHPEVHPAYQAWLSSLSAGSQATAQGSSEKIAKLLFNGNFSASELPWHELRYQHLSDLKAALAKDHSPATVNKLLAFVRGILKQCWLLDMIDGPAYRKAITIKEISYKREPSGRALAWQEIEALIGACDRTTAKGSRDAAMVAILYSAGLRRSELVSLRLEDYEQDTGRLIVRHGKGDKDRVMVLNNGGKQALDAWLRFRKTENEGRGYIFSRVLRGGHVIEEGIAPCTVFDVLRSLAKRAEIAAFSPHDLRRTAITHLLERGADLAIAQKFAGHSNPATTSRYDRRGEEALRKAVELLAVPY